MIVVTDSPSPVSVNDDAQPPASGGSTTTSKTIVSPKGDTKKKSVKEKKPTADQEKARPSTPPPTASQHQQRIADSPPSHRSPPFSSPPLASPSDTEEDPTIALIRNDIKHASYESEQRDRESLRALTKRIDDMAKYREREANKETRFQYLKTLDDLRSATASISVPADKIIRSKDEFARWATALQHEVVNIREVLANHSNRATRAFEKMEEKSAQDENLMEQWIGRMENILTASQQATPPSGKGQCAFCSLVGHESVDCRSHPDYTARTKKASELGLCRWCLGKTGQINVPAPRHDGCSGAGILCNRCIDSTTEDMRHHNPAFCPTNSVQQAPKRHQEPRSFPNSKAS
uniref:CCHC-type domain-containing protein n=1 Tax=Caenorhabditis tropicalis TaxID=1561998 RepID=A0A1I7SYW1_9PELO